MKGCHEKSDRQQKELLCLHIAVSAFLPPPLPTPGKTSAAITLAKQYNAACLSIDSVVLEAISDGSSSAGLRARDLCIRAALEQAQRENEGEGKANSTGGSLFRRLCGLPAPLCPSCLALPLGPCPQCHFASSQDRLSKAPTCHLSGHLCLVASHPPPLFGLQDSNPLSDL